ncbi:MAG: hypothetical protein G01um101418_865 [Parcubacteria group bacterium Gr01-1014_18]|nr:MAG: hypothetical protein Greene041636_825 [Parcubacteria group bacterium Greene0416_36]TSC79866.1 MAG: hypothetical protein G01um101418_865 [Parcubacteria group bacterium Gr01-1014_18]TSC98298.1 MAG: hypothetical protein Greene101420_802 [Parcubacteria group bacterium Greene1014_20]TSD06661.1 MAG: hypothetical protein Greene07142_713 [Parcubacteria group bacterium Greene0714_2]
MHYDILDSFRRDLLPAFGAFKGEFYLAGGTALALQLGHRDSFDFDFFKKEDFDPMALWKRLEKHFVPHSLQMIQNERNTLSVIIGEKVKLSFFSYDYPMIEPLLPEPYLNMAGMLDIGCMKLSAIIARATLKDYVDLYYILHNITLPSLLEKTALKFSHLDQNLVLKSLLYFEDVVEDPVIFKKDRDISWPAIQDFLKKEVGKIYRL